MSERRPSLRARLAPAAVLLLSGALASACAEDAAEPEADAADVADSDADVAGADATDVADAEAWPCRPDGVAPPHAPGTPYLGVHANPQNNDLVRCALSGDWEQRWHALQGLAIAQPNTFSPDGATLYVTTSARAEDGCTVHALDAASGAARWCRAETDALGGSVAVDADGNLYATLRGGVVSFAADGAERWRREYLMPDGSPGGPTGLHLHPAGFVALAAGNGAIELLARDTGAPAASLSVYDDAGLPRVERPGLAVDLEPLLPEEVVDDFVATFGSVDQLLAIFAGIGDQWTDNTIGVAPDGTLYGIGSGYSADSGAVVQVRVEPAAGEGGGVTLSPGWIATFSGGSASSPSISPDGRYLKITDGNSTAGLLNPASVEARALVFDIDACDENTDADALSERCAPALLVPLRSGPALGASPMLDDLEHYVWEVQFAGLFDNDVPDLIRYDGADEVWPVHLPGDAVWSSVLTIADEHIVGTATRFTASRERLLSIELPATATSEVVALDRTTGALVFSAPVTDDSTSTVTVGPDGSLYVTQLGLLSGFALETRITGGIIRFAPR